MHVRVLLSVSLIALVSGCSLFSTPKRAPVDLQPFTATIKPRVIWSETIGGSGNAALSPSINESDVYAAAGDGRVTKLDARGKTVWRKEAGFPVTAGVATGEGIAVVGGSDGQVAALDLATGAIRWKNNVPGELLGHIVIGGGKVILRSSDARLFALDAATGALHWTLQRPLPPLVLRADGGMVMREDLVVAAFPGGRLLGVNAATGVVRYDATIATPKGTTELERIVDVVGTPVFEGDSVCVASYQGRIGCMNSTSGQPLWGRDFSAPVGASVDGRYVYGVDEASVIQAFTSNTGTLTWTNDRFKYREINTPLSWQRAVVVGDYKGYLHFLGREDGIEIARISTNGKIRVPMQLSDALAPGSLLVQTTAGGIYLIGAE
ncbi:outer membrane protein assembly factor BamB [soil metagenome]